MSHCMKVTRIAYSSTAMTYNARDSATGAVHVHDDYREAYAWLRQNAEPDAKILGWWDYGYQISALANRTVIVDNNTWNNTHIATVGRVLTSPEEEAWPILQSLEVDYIFVLFGSRVGMSGDDLDKLPWILRIAQDVFAEEVVENEFTVNGRYLFDHENATSAMQQSLLYKMSYYRFFNETSLEDPREIMIDNVRNGNPPINASAIAFDHIEEAFTSDAWIVRIFRVKRRA
jgi:dolichyl-diphosphooligosaccharide---protein glycosyltransferase